MGTVTQGIRVSTLVRSKPYHGAEIVGSIVPYGEVEIYGSAMINGLIHYVYIKSPYENIEGWIRTRIVYPVIWDASNGWEEGLPILIERDYRNEYTDFPIAEVKKSTYYYESNILNIRVNPSLDNSIVTSLPSGMRLAVHGRTNHDIEGWVYVTAIQAPGSYWNNMVGISGWVFDPNWDKLYLRYENGVTRDSLPILASDYAG